MDFITDALDYVNWWAVLAAVVATMPVGFVWYDMKMGFGKRWSKLVGLSAKDMNSSEGMGKRFGVMLFVAFLTAVLLAVLQLHIGTDGLIEGVIFGLIIGLVFRGGGHFMHNGFAKRPDALSIIDAGHDMVSIAVMSAILAIWTK